VAFVLTVLVAKNGRFWANPEMMLYATYRIDPESSMDNSLPIPVARHCPGECGSWRKTQRPRCEQAVVPPSSLRKLHKQWG
jgi:hypothetical protein